MGAVLREQNALPYEAWIMKNLTAKDDVDNVGAGRAAKGANPVASTKKCRKLLKFPAFFMLSFNPQTPQGGILFVAYNNVFCYETYC